MAKGANEQTKVFWLLMIAQIQEKIKGNKNSSLENGDIKEINSKTNIAIGTLNGYFGLDKSKMLANYPNQSTRDILAKEILGFENWNDYVSKQNQEIPFVETETVESEITWTMDNFEELQKKIRRVSRRF